MAQYISHHSPVQCVSLRIGCCQIGKNLPDTLHVLSNESEKPRDDCRQLAQYDDLHVVQEWYRKLWLSNIDLIRLFESAVAFDIEHDDLPFTAVNGVSNNHGMRWCLENDIGYQPILDVESYDSSLLDTETEAKDAEKEEKVSK